MSNPLNSLEPVTAAAQSQVIYNTWVPYGMVRQPTYPGGPVKVDFNMYLSGLDGNGNPVLNMDTGVSVSVADLMHLSAQEDAAVGAVLDTIAAVRAGAANNGSAMVMLDALCAGAIARARGAIT